MLPWNPAPPFQGQSGARSDQPNAYGYPSGSLTSPAVQNGYAMPPSQAQNSSFGPYPSPQQPQQLGGSMQHAGQHLQQGPLGQPMPQPVSAPAPLSLGQVLHYLQTEYRRHERERNEWEIERAEMRARIALLEGERRASENLRSDLVRRVKMLEFALRGERSKYLSNANASSSRSEAGDKPSQNAASGIPPNKAVQLKTEDRPPSPLGSSPPSDAGEGFSDSASSNGQASSIQPLSGLPAHLTKEMSRPSSTISSLNSAAPGSEKGTAASVISMANNVNGTSSLVGPGGYNPAIGRDPKGRAQARFYLKQCLQEIAYLTSPGTLNPLPDRGVEGLPRPPAKGLAAIPRPQIQGPSAPGSTMQSIPGILPAPAGLIPSANVPLAPTTTMDEASALTNQFEETTTITAPPMEHSTSTESTGKHQGLPTSAEDSDDAEQKYNTVRPLVNGTSHDLNHTGLADGDEKLTGRADTWALGPNKTSSKTTANLDTEMNALSISDNDSDDSGTTTQRDDGNRPWRTKRILKSHLDAVRSIALDKNDMTIASGSDDSTIKLWRLNVGLMTSSAKPPPPDTEPQMTLRGHSGAVTALAISPASDRLYSASTDQTVQIWAMPPRDREPYAPYDPSLRLDRLEGHTDAIWSIALVPLRVRDESLLATASADGTVKIWSTEKPALKLSWTYNGTDVQAERDGPAPTSVAVVHSNMRNLAVGYQDAVVKIFDIETGRQLSRLKSDETYDGTTATQINMVAVHPTLPIVVTAHEDRYVRFFDLNTGACTHSVLAHTDAVTSVDIDPSGLSLASAGHDNSIRIWDMLSTRTCVQEMSSHRSNGSEGALDVKYHANLPFLASAGADGIIKVYAS